jgi:hypothetical protein
MKGAGVALTVKFPEGDVTEALAEELRVSDAVPTLVVELQEVTVTEVLAVRVSVTGVGATVVVELPEGVVTEALAEGFGGGLGGGDCVSGVGPTKSGSGKGPQRNCPPRSAFVRRGRLVTLGKGKELRGECSSRTVQ